MHIGEFISQYTLIEMDKTAAKSQNVLGKFQTKLVMQKVATNAEQ